MELEQARTYLWRMTYELVKTEGYQLLQSGDDVVYLLRNRGRNYQCICLELVDFVWPAEPGRRMLENERMLKQIRSRMRARRVDCLHVYLFISPPYPELSRQIEKKSRVEAGWGTLYTFVFSLTGHALFDPDQTVSEKEDILNLFGLNQPIQTSLSTSYEWTYADQWRRQAEQIQYQREKREKEIMLSGKPRFTMILIVIHLILFALMELAGGSQNPYVLILFGAKFNELIVQGEWWRLVTPMFLHIGFIHLLFNNIALYFIGSVAERIYGSLRFLIIYLCAGVAGVIASFYFSPSLSAGASGAIFGLFGSLLHFGVRYRNLFFRTMGNDVIMIVVLNLAIGLMFPDMIDNFAHIGGLFAGFLASFAVGLPLLAAKFKFQRFVVFVLLLSILVAGVKMGFDKRSTVYPSAHDMSETHFVSRAEVETRWYS